MNTISILWIGTVVVFSSFIEVSSSSCPETCVCRSTPRCPPGVSLIRDGCNCCKVCAKQLNQPCNNNDEPCDYHRRLFCKYPASSNLQRGVCKIRRGRHCLYNGERFENGAMIETSCKRDCQCLDGSISCVIKCPQESAPPPLSECPNARLRSVEDRCCNTWMCDTRMGPRPYNSNFQYEVSELQGNRKLLKPEIEAVLTNRVYSDVVYEWDGGSDGDEIEDYQVAISETGESDSETLNWRKTNNFPGEDDVSHEQPLRCSQKTSSWSSCSKSCGLGVSTRVSNSNPDCQLKRETRLCMVRTCQNQQRLLTTQTRKRCIKQRPSQNRLYLTYAGCRSTRTYKPTFCGTCADTRKCCQPRSTRTVSIRFSCESGETFDMKFSWIRSCRCNRRECSSSQDNFISRRNSLENESRRKQT